jgi:hypothetical protein
VHRCNIVTELAFGQSLGVEIKPEVVISPAFTPRLKQESTKMVRLFNSVVRVPDTVHCKFEA